jgi:hypothetical protein
VGALETQVISTGTVTWGIGTGGLATRFVTVLPANPVACASSGITSQGSIATLTIPL